MLPFGDSGYNLRTRAESNLGVPKSETTKKRMSKPKSAKHSQNISKARKGIKLSEDTKKKLSKINKGKALSAETCKKMSASRCKYIWVTPEGEFNTIKDAAEYYGVRTETIGHRVKRGEEGYSKILK